MNKKLKNLIRAFLDSEGTSHRNLVDALIGAPEPVLAEVARHKSGAVRCAAVEAARGRTEPGILDLVDGLARDDYDDVRRALARTLAAAPDWDVHDATLRQLLTDAIEDVRRDAVRAAAGRPALARELHDRLCLDDGWEVRQAAAEALARAEPRDALPVLLHALSVDSDRDVRHACGASAERHLETLGGYPDDLRRPKLGQLAEALARVDRMGKHRFPRLRAWLQERVARDVDPETLAEFGKDLTAEAEKGELPRAHRADDAVDTVVRSLTGEGPRAAVLIGESGTGKTAIVQEVVHRLRAARPAWRVVQVTPSSLLAGTLWMGEWESKVARLIDAARAPKRVLLYMPNFEQLSEVGTHSRSSRNVGDMLAPHIEKGELALLGESTPDAYRSARNTSAAFRRLFTRIEIEPATAETTRALLADVCTEAGVDPGDEALDRLMELTDFYLPGTAQPGRALGLLRQVLRDADGESFSARAILDTLAASTGIPVDFLDDGVPLDPDRVREFFESRVMGQPEAIEAVVDLVTLVKAGLNDPDKPYGVLFFVGPTGVGKTELARTLAELLFGNPARLLRYDMSEYATYDAYERLIGSPERAGTLTSAVREQPFRVVLLDEIEKAHVNVFDLCLQIFDAGRLTDGQGKTTDFRNSIIILTSNVGSRAPGGMQLGFGGGPAPPPDADTVLRELKRYFRPEFLNRLDRIVHFRQLAEETAERIARREVRRVVARSGIARRRLVVDVDPALVALLLKRGYSREFGARPLKRTVERMVLLPVARAIAGGGVRPGSVLRLLARGGNVTVDVVEAEPQEPVEEAPPVAVAEVAARVEELRELARPVRARKAALLDRSNAPGFWEDRRHALRILDEIHRLDHVLDDLDRLDANVARTADNPDRGRAREFAVRHAREAARLRFLLECNDLADAIVTVTRVKAQNGGLEGVERLARMYAGLAKRRGLECEVIDDRRGGEPSEDTITLAVGGAGAHALLRGETGLHHLSHRLTGAPHPERRELVRVEVLRAPADETPYPEQEVRAETRPLRAAEGRLIARPKVEVHLLHLPTMTSVTSWSTRRDVARLQPWLRARVEGAGAATRDATVRRYRLGTAPLIRDRRTGRSTGKVEQVLRGELDLFLTP